MAPQHIAIFNSVSGAVFQRRFNALLESHGFVVHDVHAIDESEYRQTKGRLQRLVLRWKLYGGFCFKVARFMLFGPGRHTMINIVTTNPFFMPAFVNLLSRRPERTNICLLYDLFPEALVAAGLVKADGLPARIVAGVSRSAFSRSAATVFLGARTREYVESRYPPVRHSVVIPVGADGTVFRRELPKRDPRQPITVLYSGGMGLMHEVQTLVSYFQRPLPPLVRFRFCSNGIGYEKLKAAISSLPAVQSGQISLGGALNDADWIAEMKAAHVALVTMAPGSERVVMPSKTYSALAAGLGVLALCPADSDLAALVTAEKCGWVVPPGDIDGLARVIEQIGRDDGALDATRQRSYEAGQGTYEMATLTKTWTKLFKTIGGGGE
jgi:glycosyltransferase involved in cell wall biosynthesis